MTLQRRLAYGILLVLLVIAIFFGLTALSFFGIDKFGRVVLPLYIQTARLYERLGDDWMAISEEVERNIADQNRSDALATEPLVVKFETSLSQIEALINDPVHRKVFLDISRLASSYTLQLRQLDRIVSKRNSYFRRENEKRMLASKALSSKVTELSNRFRGMKNDFTEALKKAEFLSSSGETSSLMTHIAKIEKDLIMAEGEVNLYLQHGNNTSIEIQRSSGNSALAERIDKRLQAVLALLDKSVGQAKTPIHLRVLGNVRNGIREFKRSFQGLREILENPESEKFEIDDEISVLKRDMIDVRKRGFTKAQHEAESYWSLIGQTSLELQSTSRSDFQISVIFLAVAFFCGLYIFTIYPGRIGGPLQELNRQIKEYKLGSPFSTVSSSGTSEIDSLSDSFQSMSDRLNAQGDVNKNYLDTILGLREIYRELYSTGSDFPGYSSLRLEKAINKILKQLISGVPSIDIAKVMWIETKKAGDRQERFFIRIGDPVFSQRFKENPEYKIYCASTGWSDSPTKPSKDERVPFEDGLTGYLADNLSETRIGSGDLNYSLPTYSPISIDEVKVLANRNYEKGLKGGLFAEPIAPPENQTDIEQLGKSHYSGLLFLYFINPDVRLSWQEISFIKIMCGQIMSIKETDNLLDEKEKKARLDIQLQLAAEIQEHLLPQKSPEIQGLKINSLSQPASEVGGDYFDFFILDDKRLGIVIADASGKNVPAAILMTIFKTTLSTMDLPNMPAHEVLTKSNRIILKNITNDRFITAMYVIINIEAGLVELACAGHHPVMLISGKGFELSLSEKSAPGIPLGIGEIPYQAVTFKLKPSDKMMFYTDGVTEARNSVGEEFGMSRLKKFLAKNHGSNPTKELSQEIEAFVGPASRHDDITAVLVEYYGRK